MTSLKLVAFGSIASFVFCWVFLDRESSWAKNPEAFQPIIEAELPAGFPSFTPVGKIEVKQYPGYRKAESDPNGFWKLFMHIKKNEIAMTAPVEMTYAGGDGSKPRPANMAFLYGRPDLGSIGDQDKVQVVDVAPMTVVSIGVRGARTDAAIESAQNALQDWIAAQQGRFAAVGPVRVMAYNSPFVPKDRNFFEVQIPVQRTET
jgi:hypothetical protein